MSKLKVIGAGFGRTGTMSLKLALEALDLGPCYHMSEVSNNEGHVDLWEAAEAGKRVDWDKLFERYQSTVDWPSTRFWRQLADHYADAKIVLTLRDPDEWYDSMSNTIFRALTSAAVSPDPLRRRRRHMSRMVILEGTFDGAFTDREYVIDVFNQHNDMVRESVPAERLLEYEPGDGWEPLCEFLGVPVPSKPYPKTNTTVDFQERMLADQPGKQPSGNTRR